MNVMLTAPIVTIIVIIYWFLHFIMEDKLGVGRAEKVKVR